MNITRGRVAHSVFALLPFAVACMFAVPAQAQVTCSVNPMSGRYEAALAWQNTLGVDRANAMCQSLQVNAATKVVGIPTSQSKVSRPVGSEQKPSPEADAIAKQVIAQMDAMRAERAASKSTTVAVPAATVAVRSPEPVAVKQTTTSVAPLVASAATTQPTETASRATGTFTFAVTPADRTFREVIGKWSSIAGWSFTPEDWAVPRDIPVGGADVFSGNFKDAVVRLLKSSLLGDSPARPCFYSNHVVRVIPAGELCQRTNL